MTLDDKTEEGYLPHDAEEIGLYEYYHYEDRRIGKDEIISELEERGISADELKGFHKNLRIFERAYLLLHDIPKDIANSYCPLPIDDEDESTKYIFYEESRAKCIEYFHKESISPEDALRLIARYDSRFKIAAYDMIHNHFLPEQANKYDHRFNADEVYSFLRNKISPEEANFYPSTVDAKMINFLRLENINLTNYPKESIEKIGKLLNLIKKQFGPEIYTQDFSIIGTGMNGIVIRFQDIALKFSENIPHESRLMRKAISANKGDLEYVVRITDNNPPSYTDDYLLAEHEREEAIRELQENNPLLNIDDLDENELTGLLSEYKEESDFFYYQKHHPAKDLNKLQDKLFSWLIPLEGETLETVLNKKSKLPYEKCTRYSRDILNGILELRNAGIYHRDLHPKNIIVAEKVDVDVPERAIIIDLGEATDNPNEIYQGNRAYGGNNDLISLGQLMYKMATGQNLFNESLDFTCYSAVKDGVKTVREEVYDNPQKKDEYLSKVRENIEDRELSEIIIELLDDDLWTQPSLERVQEMQKVLVNYKL